MSLLRLLLPLLLLPPLLLLLLLLLLPVSLIQCGSRHCVLWGCLVIPDLAASTLTHDEQQNQLCCTHEQRSELCCGTT
jgi:hypothetical protein